MCGPGLISGKRFPVTQHSPAPSSAWLYFLCELKKVFLYTVFGYWITDQYSLECVFVQDFCLWYFLLILGAYLLGLYKDYQIPKSAWQLLFVWRILDSAVYTYKIGFGRKGSFIGKFLGKIFDSSLRTFWKK